MSDPVVVERARLADVPAMQRLINYFADRGEMLHRSLDELYENVRDFHVVREEGKVIACAAVHVLWPDLAEMKSVAVSETHQRRGIGSRLVGACLEEARVLGLGRVFCMTFQVEFFASCGFERLDVVELPHKVWDECLRCPNFPHCDEVAMIYRFAARGTSRSAAAGGIATSRS